ncbi:MAG: hypothetical protein RI894_1888 [Bacteroidota bacterium]|jgi:hypothetical protein
MPYFLGWCGFSPPHNTNPLKSGLARLQSATQQKSLEKHERSELYEVKSAILYWRVKTAPAHKKTLPTTTVVGNVIHKKTTNSER